MNILHINLNFYESSLYAKFNESLLKHGCNSHVLFPTLRNYEQTKYPSYLLIKKILNKSDRYFFKRRNKKVVNLIENENIIHKYDLLHAHSLFSNGNIAYTLKKRYGVPYIVAVRNTDINHFFKKRILLRKLGIEILRNAEKIIFISKPYKDLLINKYIPYKFRNEISNKIKVIPNGIDEYWHKNKYYRTKNRITSPIKILSVGVIDKNKNILTSIKACEILISNKNMDVQLTVVGDVKDYSILKKIKKHKFVKHVPAVTKEKLIQYYRNSTLFLMPSIKETFGLVYAEAMSQGLPVLYSKGQGFDEQFKNGVVGYAVEKISPNDIAEKILLTLESYQEISKKCIDSVSKFDWDKISKKYIEIYTEILQ